MLSLDLFDSKYEQKLHEGAVDQLEQHRIDVLNDRMQELLARARTADAKTKSALKQEFEKIKSERDSYYRIRETQQGQDVVDRKEKMKALTPAKPSTMGAVKDVAQGLKNWLQGKPESGPTYEAQKKNSKPPLDQRLQRLKVQARREFPRAHSDEEALLLKLLDKEARDSALNRQVNARQDAELKRNFDFDREQEDEIEDLQAQVSVREHGGGIGPRQRWQDLMKNEGWSDKHNPTPYSVYIDGREWKTFGTDEHARNVANKVRASLKQQGRDQTVTIGPSQAYLNKKINETNQSKPAEEAILKRIMVAHKDLLIKYGPEKVMQAAEDVAYNVGDQEIGSSDVSGWVRQVEQILGARP